MIKRFKKLLLLANALGLTLLSSPDVIHAALLDLPESPLFVTGFVDPNIMFLVDNSGSMNNIVPDAPYDPNSTDISCPESNALGNGAQIDIRINSAGIPYFTNGTEFDWGTRLGEEQTGATGRSLRCFIPDTDYMARLYGGSGAEGSTKSANSYLAAQYSGHYLNWYFGSIPAVGCASYSVDDESNSWESDARNHPCNERRMDIAQEATRNLINSLSNVRVGLASYDGSTGATINVGIDDVSSNRPDMLTAIDGLRPDGATPLAESLHDIGRYFVGEDGTPNAGGPNGQYDGNLVLHPDKASQIILDDDTVFNRSPNYAGVSSESPIQAFCQQNFAVLLTDGRPQQDQDISSDTGLQDYDGDCISGHENFNGAACNSFDQKSDQVYESEGSDYLDDVAKALHEIDLRPDMDNFDGSEVLNNIITYTIGFADDQVINDPLMQDTADNGGGLFLQAADADALASAFAAATADIFSQIGSAAAVGATSGSVRTGSRIYQGRFNSGNWSGQLLSIPVNLDGSLSPPEWDAALKLTDAFVSSSRKILTYDPSASPKGIPFRYTNLSATQKTAMNTDADGNVDTAGSERGENRTNYIRGMNTDESPNGEGYRPRTTPLGDIMNSEPIFVGAPSFDYPDDLEASGGQTYSTFKVSSIKDRTPVVYVGANDGMLHGFDASVAANNTPTATSGQEVIAYIPSKLIPKLSKLTDPNYSHQTYVDASPIAGDIYTTSNTWSTILSGALGRGGQSLYGLDITNPSAFSESNVSTVLWEFTDTNDPDLGYVYGRPAIVRMAPATTGKWAVVTGNGYNNSEADGAASITGHAVLFVLNAQTGTLIQKIDTGEGTVATPNALAPPAPVDFNGDNIIDIIYAGDLYGNLWKFDVTDSSPASWTATKLFTAVDATVMPSRLPPRWRSRAI